MADTSPPTATSKLDLRPGTTVGATGTPGSSWSPDECVIMTGSRYNLCGYPMPYLIPFIREELAFDIDFRTTRPRTA